MSDVGNRNSGRAARKLDVGGRRLETSFPTSNFKLLTSSHSRSEASLDAVRDVIGSERNPSGMGIIPMGLIYRGLALFFSYNGGREDEQE